VQQRWHATCDMQLLDGCGLSAPSMAAYGGLHSIVSSSLMP
jgi:hypothetical protein